MNEVVGKITRDDINSLLLVASSGLCLYSFFMPAA